VKAILSINRRPVRPPQRSSPSKDRLPCAGSWALPTRSVLEPIIRRKRSEPQRLQKRALQAAEKVGEPPQALFPGRVPHVRPAYTGFPVDLACVGELHAAFLDESRTRGCWWRPVQEIRIHGLNTTGEALIFCFRNPGQSRGVKCPSPSPRRRSFPRSISRSFPWRRNPGCGKTVARPHCSPPPRG